MNYKPGDRVVLVSRRGTHWNPDGEMDEYLGQTVTFESQHLFADPDGNIRIRFDGDGGWYFRTTDIVRKAGGSKLYKHILKNE